MKESKKYMDEEKAEEDCWSAQDEEIEKLKAEIEKMDKELETKDKQIKEFKQIIMDIKDYATINFDEKLLQLIEGLKDGKNRRDILYGKT